MKTAFVILKCCFHCIYWELLRNKMIPNENLLLVGESYGGYLSRGIVYNMPDRVDGLLLICPVIIADSGKRTVPEHVVLKKDEKLLSNLTQEEIKEFSAVSVVQSKHIYEKYKNEILVGLEIADDVDQLERKYTKPVLLLLGKQDSVVGYKDAWNILKNYARATFAVLDKAGHNLQMNKKNYIIRSLMSGLVVSRN